MKSKLTTYLLIIAVAAVWGVIAWKMLSPPEPGPSEPAARPTTAKDAAPDTLLLNYRDPFLSGRRVANAEPSGGFSMRPLPPAPAVKKATKHNIRYVGRIRRQGVDYSLAEVNGHLHTLRPGETADDYRLDKIFPDSLHFTFDGERCCIKLSQ